MAERMARLGAVRVPAHPVLLTAASVHAPSGDDHHVVCVRALTLLLSSRVARDDSSGVAVELRRLGVDETRDGSAREDFRFHLLYTAHQAELFHRVDIERLSVGKRGFQVS